MIQPQTTATYSLSPELRTVLRELRPMRYRRHAAIPAPIRDDARSWVSEPFFDGRRVIVDGFWKAVATPAHQKLEPFRYRGLKETIALAAAHGAVFDGLLVRIDRTTQRPTDFQEPDGTHRYTVIAFDLLVVEGRSVMDLKLKARQRLMDATLVGPGAIRRSRWLTAAPDQALDMVKERGLPALLVRHLDAPYVPGTHSELGRVIVAGTASPALGDWVHRG